ncbi:MAG: hypothetical protein ACTTID_03805 [Bacillales bacterium]
MKKLYKVLTLFFLIISTSSCANSNKNNNWFKDDEYHWHSETVWEMNYSSRIIKIKDKNAHDYTDWTVNTIPTVENEGSRYRKCKVCNHLQLELLPKLIDNNVNEYNLYKHCYNFFDINEFESFLCNKFSKYNKESCYLIHPIKVFPYITRPLYELYYNEIIDQKYIDICFKESFHISDSKIRIIDPEMPEMEGNYPLMFFNCSFYPFNDKNINLNNIEIVNISKYCIKLTCDNFFKIYVRMDYPFMLYEKNIKYAIEYIKTNLYKFN